MAFWASYPSNTQHKPPPGDVFTGESCQSVYSASYPPYRVSTR